MPSSQSVFLLAQKIPLLIPFSQKISEHVSFFSGIRKQKNKKMSEDRGLNALLRLVYALLQRVT